MKLQFRVIGCHLPYVFKYLISNLWSGADFLDIS